MHLSDPVNEDVLIQEGSPPGVGWLKHEWNPFTPRSLLSVSQVTSSPKNSYHGS